MIGRSATGGVGMGRKERGSKDRIARGSGVGFGVVDLEGRLGRGTSCRVFTTSLLLDIHLFLFTVSYVSSLISSSVLAIGAGPAGADLRQILR